MYDCNLNLYPGQRRQVLFRKPGEVSHTDDERNKLATAFPRKYSRPLGRTTSFPAHRCSQVRMAGVQDPFPQDETVPIAVGSTLAVAAVAVVVGYALYRSVFVRRVDYNTMN